jgi:hypothetical protein
MGLRKMLKKVGLMRFEKKREITTAPVYSVPTKMAYAEVWADNKRVFSYSALVNDDRELDELNRIMERAVGSFLDQDLILAKGFGQKEHDDINGFIEDLKNWKHN